MDKDFHEVTKESSSENSNNVIVTADQDRSLPSEEKKEHETINNINKGTLSSKDCVHRHSLRVTASHSTIEHVGGKNGDSKRSNTGHPRSKSFLEQLPMPKGSSLTRVIFNGKKGIQGSHGDGLSAISYSHGKGSLLNESLEKGEDQQKKPQILQPSYCLNSTRVAQRLFDSSVSFADLVRACGQRQKRRLHTVQLNNSLLSTPQSSTLVSNYFNKYRSYLDHLRKTYEHDEQELLAPNVRPQVTPLSLPLACMTPTFSDEIVHDPDYAQILEKTTTESIRNLWSYQNKNGESKAILLPCRKIERTPISENRGHPKKRSLESVNCSEGATDIQNHHNKDFQNVFLSKTDSFTSVKPRDKGKSVTHSIDCLQDYTLKPHGTRTSPEGSGFELTHLRKEKNPDVSMKTNMASLLPNPNGTAEWRDNERKPQSIGYSFRLRNQSAIDTLVQNQQRMIQQKQQEQQQQQHESTQTDTQTQQSQSLQNNNINKIQGGSNSRHKICSRFQGMNASTANPSGAISTSPGNLLNSSTSGIHASLANSLENTNVIGSQAQNNGIYPLESLTSENTTGPCMSGTMAYTRTLKASYACLDPNSAMSLSTKDGYGENLFGEVENETLPSAFHQTLETLGESKWRDVQSRQTILNRENKNLYGQNPETLAGAQERPRTMAGFLEPEQSYHWSTGQKGPQRPIIKVNKESDFEPYMNPTGKKEKNGFTLMGEGAMSDQSMSQKHWGAFSLPDSNSNRTDTTHDVTDSLITSHTNGNSRLHQWRQDLSSFGSLNYQTRDTLPLPSHGGFAEVSPGQRLDPMNYSSDNFTSLGKAPCTKSSWSTTYEESPLDKNASKYLPRSHSSMSNELLDNSHLQHPYQPSRITDHRHRLFNNNNASGLFMNGKHRQHYDTNSLGASSEPWSNATCDDMAEYFDSSLQFGDAKSEIISSHISASTINTDVNSGKGLHLNPFSVNFSSHSSQGMMGGYSTTTSAFDNRFNHLESDRMTSNSNSQKDVPHSSSSFSDIPSLQTHDQKRKHDDLKRNSDDPILLPHDLKDECNQFDINTCDTKTLNSPWYELAPVPEDTEEIRNDKNREQGQHSQLNFLENASNRDHPFHSNANDINHQLQQSFISMGSSVRGVHGNQRIENKPRLILGANTINRKKHDQETDSSMPDNERNGMLGNSSQDDDKIHLKQFPFPCHAKHGCPSSSHLNINQFQTPQFQMAGIKHQQHGAVPQHMYCIPNILVPPPNQGQGRHPGVLSYPGMMGNMTSSTPFPQGVVRVPLVDMSRLVYLQSLPFNATSANHTPNSNHNNSSSSNPHVNTSNIITINTADNDFSLTGDKGQRTTKTSGIRGKGTLLRLRPNNTVCDASMQGLRSNEECLLSKGTKVKPNRNPWDADLEHDFSSSLFSKVTTLDQSRLNPDFGLVYPDGQTGSNSVTSETNFRSASGMHWPSTPDIHPEMLDMLPVRKQPIEDYSGRQVCWPDMELVMSSTREQLQVIRKSNKPLGSNKANLISILPKATPGDVADGRGGKETNIDRVEI